MKDIESKNIFSFYNLKLFYALTSPLFYIVTLFENLICTALFFLSGTFFSGTQVYPLLSFFSLLPVLCALVIPLFFFSITNEYDDYLPFSHLSQNLAKCSAALTLFFISVVPLFTVPFSINLFTNVDFLAFFEGVFFVLLFALSSVAICCFSKVLSEKKLSSFFIAFFLLLIFSFALSILNGGRFSEVFARLSLYSRQGSSSKGIFDSRDFFFYIEFSLFFIFVSELLYLKKRGAVFNKKQKWTSFFVFLIIVLSFLNTEKYYFRFDFTEGKNYSLSSYTKNLISGLEDTVYISYFRTPNLKAYYPSSADIEDFLYEYSSFKNVLINVRSADDEEVKKLLERQGINPRSVETKGNGRLEYSELYSCIFIEYKGRALNIPFTLTSRNLEFLLDEKIVTLSSSEDDARHVLILPSYSEASTGAYDYIGEFLTSSGFTCDVYNPLNPLSGKPCEWILKNQKEKSVLLVLGSEDFSSEDVHEIENFMERGGHCLFAVSPFKKEYEEEWKVGKVSSRKLISLLETYGFRFSSSFVNDISSARLLMEDDSSYSKFINYPMWPEILPQAGAKNGLTLFWPCALELLNEVYNDEGATSIEPLLFTSRYSWREEFSASASGASSGSGFVDVNPFVVEGKEIPSKDKLKEEVVALRISGSAYGFYNPGVFDSISFTLVSDQNFLDSLLIGYIGHSGSDYRNLDFLLKELYYQNGEKELSLLHEKSLDSRGAFFKVSDEESFIKKRNAVFALNFLLVPVLIFAMFIVFYVFRKRAVNAERKEGGEK